jgi:outer membrane protein assembly factor BamB
MARPPVRARAQLGVRSEPVSFDGPGDPPSDHPPADHGPPERPAFRRPPFTDLPADEPPFDVGYLDPGRVGRGPVGRGPVRGPVDRGPFDRPAFDTRARGRRPSHAARPGAEPPPPAAPQPAGGRRRSAARLAVVALALVGVGAAVAIRQVVGSDVGAEPDATGWAVEQYGNSQMLVSDGGRVCSVSADNLVFCLDAATGDELFTRQLYASVVTAPVLVGERLVVAGSTSGSAGSLSAHAPDGGDLWEVPMDVAAGQPMPVAGEVVAVVDGDATSRALVGVDGASGAELWRAYDTTAGVQPQVVASTVLTDGTRFYAAVVDPGADPGASGQVVAIDPGSGTEVWRSPVMPTITVSRGVTSVAPFDDGSAVALVLEAAPGEAAPGQVDGPVGRVVALDSATGALRWEVSLAGTRGSVAHVDGLTVVIDGAELRAYDAAGTQVWTAAAPVPGEAQDGADPDQLVYDGGHLFAVGHGVYEIDPTTGTSGLVLDSGTTSDVAVVGGHVVIAGVFALTAVPVSDLPLGDEPVTVVTG